MNFKKVHPADMYLNRDVEFECLQDPTVRKWGLVR